MSYYKEEMGKFTKLTDAEAIAAFNSDTDRRVAKTQIGDVIVSTVWLVMDHSFSDKGPPVIYETMIFNWDKEEEYQERYSTRQQAQKGHREAVLLVLNSQKDDNNTEWELN